MKATRFLSQEEKETGIKYHLGHQRFNGAGFNFIGDTPITLLAIYFGASNVQLGYLASVLYLTGILLLLVPRLFAGRNLAQLHFWFWLSRGLICLFYSALWFVSDDKAVLIILITYTLFCSTRIVGVALYQPILRMISTAQNRGETVARSSINFQMTLTGARLVSFLITSIQRLSGIAGLLILQYLGIIFNTIAAFYARKVPCRETVKYRRGDNIWKTFIHAMKKKELRTAVTLNWASVGIMILFGFLVPFLRREARLSTSNIFLFTLIIALSNIIAGYYTKIFADRLGGKTLLAGGLAAIGVCALIWVFLPPETPLLIILPLGLITGFFLNSNNMLVSRVILKSLPEGNTVGFSSMLNFVIALISIGIGTGGGYLADNQSLWDFPFANGYSLTFFMAFCGSMIALFLSLRIREPESRSSREVVGILFSPTNLQTFWQIGRLNRETDPLIRRTLLMHIGKTDNSLTTEEIHSIMANPLSSDKGEVIKTLFTFPRKELLSDLMREAENPSSRHRIEAIFALGAYPYLKNQKLLERLLDDQNPEIRSNAAKSLGRTGAEEHLEKIRLQAADAEGIWNQMNYIIALKNIDQNAIYLGDVFAPRFLKENNLHRQTLYSLYARVLNLTPRLEEIYRQRNQKKGTGLEDFLDEARDVPAFLDSHNDFIKWFAGDNSDMVCCRCQEILEGTPVQKKLKYLKISIRELSEENRDYDDALAVLYFTYHLMKNKTS